MSAPPQPLTEERIAFATHQLAARDPDFAAIVAACGVPPIWARPQGFPTLVHIILEQQVSLASARAAFNKLLAALDELTPLSFLRLDDAQLKQIGFSRQKTGYVRGLAAALLEGGLDLTALNEMPDDDARRALVAVKGIGHWTADIYLLMALLRPDVWPKGDLALISAVRAVKQLPVAPDAETLTAMSEAWRPWRSVAARLFWHYYLSGAFAKQ